MAKTTTESKGVRLGWLRGQRAAAVAQLDQLDGEIRERRRQIDNVQRACRRRCRPGQPARKPVTPPRLA